MLFLDRDAPHSLCPPALPAPVAAPPVTVPLPAAGCAAFCGVFLCRLVPAITKKHGEADSHSQKHSCNRSGRFTPCLCPLKPHLKVMP